jgi:predicted GIY-YIG superfamily endonuclease
MSRAIISQYYAPTRGCKQPLSERFESEATAVKRERQIKRWSREKKRASVEGNIARLTEISKPRR